MAAIENKGVIRRTGVSGAACRSRMDCRRTTSLTTSASGLERFPYKCTGAAGRFGAHGGVARPLQGAHPLASGYCFAGGSHAIRNPCCTLCGSPHGAPHALPCTPNQPASPAHLYGNRSSVQPAFISVGDRDGPHNLYRVVFRISDNEGFVCREYEYRCFFSSGILLQGVGSNHVSIGGRS